MCVYTLWPVPQLTCVEANPSSPSPTQHHCRNCGKSFCHNCSSRAIPLPRFGIEEPVRVCDMCYGQIKRGGGGGGGSGGYGRGVGGAGKEGGEGGQE